MFGDLQETSSGARIPQQIGVRHGELVAGRDGKRRAHVQPLPLVEVMPGVRHAAMILQGAQRIETA